MRPQNVDMAAVREREGDAGPLLTVVLITRNQAWNVARLIESVLAETAGVRSTEIVLVDSDSTDGTIQLAARYPITILRLYSARFRTAAAGRSIGCAHSAGRLVLFLDGDMELCRGWLRKALDVMQESPSVAGVTGVIVHLAATATDDDKPRVTDAGMNPPRETPCADGSALYRRSVLEQVGGFDPFLYSEEEPELGIRLRRAGYRIVRLDWPIAFHYADQAGTLSSLGPRWRRNLYLGAGQVLRHHVGSGVFWQYLRERGYAVGPMFALATGAAGFAWSLVTHTWLWLGAWALLVAGMIGAGSYRRRLGPYQTAYSVAHRLLVLAGTIRGVLLYRPGPGTPPGEVEVIRSASNVQNGGAFTDRVES